MISCKFEHGHEASLRHVTVCAIVTNDNNEVLLTKRAPHLLRGNMYTVPGGFLDRNETTQQGVLREIKEETGLLGKIDFLLRINDTKRPKEDRQNVDFIYVVKAEGDKFKDNSEVIETKWFNKNNLPPDSEFAFDHRESIELYFDYLQKPFPVPIIGAL